MRRELHTVRAVNKTAGLSRTSGVCHTTALIWFWLVQMVVGKSLQAAVVIVWLYTGCDIELTFFLLGTPYQNPRSATDVCNYNIQRLVMSADLQKVTETSLKNK